MQEAELVTNLRAIPHPHMREKEKKRTPREATTKARMFRLVCEVIVSQKEPDSVHQILKQGLDMHYSLAHFLLFHEKVKSRCLSP